MRAFFFLFIIPLFLLSNQINAEEALSSETLKGECVLDLLKKRYSGRLYDPSRSVSQKQLEQLMEAARLAPSSYNEQPWRFLICDKNTNPEAYQKVFSTLVEFNQGWAKNAPVLIVSIADAKNQKGTFNSWAEYDTGAAAFTMMVEAEEMGLMSHQMGGFDREKLKTLFSLPKEWTPMAVMAIGYASKEDKAPEKDRKPAQELFFFGKIGR